MKRKQKRYTEEKEILDVIDATHLKRHSLILQAGQCTDEERLLKINASVRRIEDTTLPKLKNLLAAFRTQPMSIVDDAGVVL